MYSPTHHRSQLLFLKGLLSFLPRNFVAIEINPILFVHAKIRAVVMLSKDAARSDEVHIEDAKSQETEEENNQTQESEMEDD